MPKCSAIWGPTCAVSPSIAWRPARIKSKSKTLNAPAKALEVEIWTEEKIDVNEEKLGLKGSPTKVKKAGAKEMKAAGQVHDGLSPEEAADLIIAKLKEKYII